MNPDLRRARREHLTATRDDFAGLKRRRHLAGDRSFGSLGSRVTASVHGVSSPARGPNVEEEGEKKHGHRERICEQVSRHASWHSFYHQHRNRRHNGHRNDIASHHRRPSRTAYGGTTSSRPGRDGIADRASSAARVSELLAEASASLPRRYRSNLLRSRTRKRFRLCTMGKELDRMSQKKETGDHDRAEYFPL